jgi:hypothetical protein
MAKVKEFDKYKNFENLFFKKTRKPAASSHSGGQGGVKKKVSVSFMLKDTYLRSYPANRRIAFVFSV